MRSRDVKFVLTTRDECHEVEEMPKLIKIPHPRDTTVQKGVLLEQRRKNIKIGMAIVGVV